MKEKKEVLDDGSWFNKHGEAITRHVQVLEITLQKVKAKVVDRFQMNLMHLAHENFVRTSILKGDVQKMTLSKQIMILIVMNNNNYKIWYVFTHILCINK